MTVKDLYQWSIHLHNNSLISKASLYELFEHYKSGQSPLGISVFKEGKLNFQYHHGSSYHYEASMYVNPIDEYTVILMTNRKELNVADFTNAIDAILRGESFEIPKKRIHMSLRAEIFHGGIEKGLKFFEEIRTNERDLYEFKNEERELIKTADYLNNNNKPEDGIGLLRYTLTLYPQSSKVSAALGEALYQQKRSKEAFTYFKKAYKLDKENKQALEMMEKLKKNI